MSGKAWELRIGSSSLSPTEIKSIIHVKLVNLKYVFAEKAELGSTPNWAEKMNPHTMSNFIKDT